MIVTIILSLLLLGCARSPSVTEILPEYLQPSPSQAYLKRELLIQQQLELTAQQLEATQAVKEHFE